ncbi:hypothetical protein [Nocardioides panacisoli]|uniref:Uncharacterized protein n=1 Tax=Nocardioides panacisoli TaxID=627624 RepID=A0ABP7J4J7_9ACTN
MVLPLGSIAVAAALVLLVVLLVLVSVSSVVVTVNDEETLPLDQATVERLAFGRLGSISGVTMTQVFPGQVSLVSRWLPGWALLVGLLTFPVGLLVLFLVRNEAVLHVRFLDDGETATTVQVAGRARKRVALDVGEIFDALALEEAPR